MREKDRSVYVIKINKNGELHSFYSSNSMEQSPS